MNRRTIKKLSEGSEEAFNLIYDKYHKLIKQICYSYVSNSDTAEDLSIETFTRVWNNKEKIDFSKNFKYYIIQIAKNLSIDYFKKIKREKTVSMDVSDLEYINSKVDSEEETTRESSNEWFIKIKDILDSESYEILVLYYYHNLKYREIAEIKGVTVSVITNKASRAIRLLKERLKDEN